MRRRDQYRCLTRHFFGEFFDNELVAPGGDVQISVTHILALLASPGLICSLYVLVKYSGTARMTAQARDALSWGDKLFFVSFAFVVMGFVTVIEWDTLFPDARDWQILRPLPLSLRTAFLAKASALGLFLVVFSLDINVLGIAVFPAVANASGATLAWWLPYAAAHAAAVFSAGAFAFFLILTAEGALMNAVGYKLFRKLSPYVQLLAVVGLLSCFLLCPAVKPGAIGELSWYPPAWFFGLYEALLGFGEFAPLARIAAAALALSALAAALAYIAGYNRHAKRCLESESPSAAGRDGAVACLADRVLVRNQPERAAFYFVFKTIARSRRHWLLLAAYSGAGFALVLETVAASLRGPGPGAFTRPSAPLLSLQLMLSFFVLMGLRYIFTVPAELRANWAFRITDTGRGANCLAGVRKAVLAFAVLPLFAALLPLHAALWGWRVALLHMAFGLLLAMLLLQALLVRFRKIPFTCSYLPGKSRLFASWVAWWALFSTYAYSMASLERWLLADWPRMAIFLLSGAIALWALESVRARLVADEISLIFDDAPEPLVQTLDLDLGR